MRGLQPIDRIRLQIILPPGETRSVLETDLETLARDMRAESVMFTEIFPVEMLITQTVEVNGEVLQLALALTSVLPNRL